MAAEIDPVIFEFIARTNKFQADLKRTTRTVDQQLGLQESKVRKLEAEFSRSSGSIGRTLKGLAGTLAAAFTGRELVGLLDSFTRLQNNLKVAGLEGENLAKVQGQLLALSQKYGTNIENLSELYGKATDAGRSFGASEVQVLQLTEATSQALRITGTSAGQASGAILGLSQALASGTVRAEEYNQINEGGLRPLLQAAAGAEKFGGDVNKLRAAMLDGTVTSQEFFAAIIAGSGELEGRASKAALTLAGGFEALTSSLTVYFGEADKANGVSAALGGALGLLADNLAILIPAIATIATGLGVGFVTNAVAARIAAAGVTGSLASMTVAAQASRTALLAAFGGPVGIAITAVAIGLTYVATQAENAQAKTERLRSKAEQLKAEADQLESNLKAAGVQVDNLGNSADGASGGVSALTQSMETARKKAAELADQAGFTANKLAALGFQEAKAERQSIQNALRQAKTSRNSQTRTGDFLATGAGSKVIGTLESQLAQAQAVEAAALRQQRLTAKAIGTGVTSAPPGASSAASAPAASSPRGGGSRGGGASGPSTDDITDRFNAELRGYAQQALSAQISLASSAEERAELEMRALEIARRETLNSIQADKDYSKAQKERLEAAVDILVFEQEAAIQFQRRQDLEREAADLAEERFRAGEEALRLQFDLADTEAERRALAFKILEAEDAYLKSKLESVIASEVTAEAEKNLARAALSGINETSGARRESLARQNEGALARYARGTIDVDTRIEELAVRKIQDINDTIADTMAKQFGIKDDFISGLLSAFLESALFGPLAQRLSGGGGGGGLLGSILGAVGALGGVSTGSVASTDGGVTGALGSIFRRASGGPVSAGQVYRVNEGASPGRVEAFRPNGGGDIIPLGRMNASRGAQGSPGTATVRLELSGEIDARIERVSGPVAVQVTRAAAPSIIDAASNETIRRSGRPRL